MPDPVRKKIAIIGGGVGGMTTAFELTNRPDAANYDITLYQLGWRLGGKGASGRNRKLGDRIEEHGLHFWFGYYENAFRMIQTVYGELGRLPGQPLATWQEAFHPHSLFVLMQFHDAQWSEWRLDMPHGGGAPGDGEVPTLWETVDRLLAWLEDHVGRGAPQIHAKVTQPEAHPGWLHALGRELGLEHDNPGALGIKAAREIIARSARSLGDDAMHGSAVQAVEHFVQEVMSAVATELGKTLEDLASWPPWWRRFVSLLLMGMFMFSGMLADKVWEPGGFDRLDDLDLREWFAKHGAPSLVTDSDTLRVAYESLFAFVHGAYAMPSLAAGAGLKGLLRLTFTYKQAFAWKMQAGMGDTIFAPMYEVLKRRGVKFEFFSLVRQVVPSADGSRIEEIHVGRQATIKAGQTEYAPLYDVKQLPCWPSEPFFDQLVEGDVLKADRVNLESFWNDWKDVRTDILRADHEFDEVVLATSIGPVPIICSGLMAQKPAWAEMVANVEAIATQSFQLWTRPDATPVPEDGDASERPIYGGFAQPFNTVSDMSQLLPRENWPPDDTPAAIFYFCGPLSEDPVFPGPQATWFPKQQSSAAMVRAQEWLRSNAQFLYPDSMYHGYPESFPDTFNFAMLYDPQPSAPIDSLRFQTQFWRANVDPSERYVLTAKGAPKYRMKPGETGYGNLTIAGDWTHSGLNYGCVEAAVMSGMAACRAITGEPLPIFGEDYPKVS